MNDQIFRARVRAGATRARAAGVRIGRPPALVRPEVARRWPMVRHRIESGEIRRREAARLLRIGASTVRRMLAGTDV